MPDETDWSQHPSLAAAARLRRLARKRREHDERWAHALAQHPADVRYVLKDGGGDVAAYRLTTAALLDGADALEARVWMTGAGLWEWDDAADTYHLLHGSLDA